MPTTSISAGATTTEHDCISSLGVIDALLGHKEAAVSEAERAVEMLPISKDALTGSGIVTNLA
jgi:hypothetical protein